MKISQKIIRSLLCVQCFIIYKSLSSTNSVILYTLSKTAFGPRFVCANEVLHVDPSVLAPLSMLLCNWHDANLIIRAYYVSLYRAYCESKGRSMLRLGFWTMGLPGSLSEKLTRFCSSRRNMLYSLLLCTVV